MSVVADLWVELAWEVLGNAHSCRCRLELFGIQHAVHLARLTTGACGARPENTNKEAVRQHKTCLRQIMDMHPVHKKADTLQAEGYLLANEL